MKSDDDYIMKAVTLARTGMREKKGGPFGCVIVKNDTVIGEGYNRVPSSGDPTAHAEIEAIRDACSRLASPHLNECVLYSTCEPCPMCLGAIYWAHIERIVFSGTRETAAAAGFDDQFIYEEFNSPPEDRRLSMQLIPHKGTEKLFDEWLKMEDKVQY